MRTGMPSPLPPSGPKDPSTPSFPAAPRNNRRGPRSGAAGGAGAPASGPDPISDPIGPSPDYRRNPWLVESRWDVEEHGPADADDRLRSAVRPALGGVRGVPANRRHPPDQHPLPVATETVRPGLVTGGKRGP